MENQEHSPSVAVSSGLTAPAQPERLAVRVQRLDPDLPLPEFARPGDAGMDLRSREDVTIAPGQRALIATGIAIAVPAGWGGFVNPRSGLAANYGITVLNAPGTVDSGYRGEVKVTLLNTDSQRSFEVHRGDRIAQLVLQRVGVVDVVEVDELDTTARGDRGFGSSGQH
ncbi:dUTP diphosphatase [Kocuria sp.]|uniref:dUTP diphosphatase n=1 Tax=Kocuria sp. TaxID=1871328 RepID=UPI003F8CF459